MARWWNPTIWPISYMLPIFIISAITAYLLLVWFKKDILVEYRFLFPAFIRKAWFLDEYYEITACDLKSSYPKFMLEHSDYSFFLRLLSCEICLSIWITGFLSLVYWSITALLLHSLFPLLLAVPYAVASAHISLFMYHALLRMMSNGD